MKEIESKKISTRAFSLFSLLLLLTVLLFAFDVSPGWAAPSNGNGNGNGSRNGNGNGEAKPEQEEKALIETAHLMRRAGMVQFNFTDIELVKFVRFMAELLQRNIIVPPTITGKISGLF